MLWNRGFGCSGWLLVGMFWFGTCEVHGDLCPLCLTTQVSIITNLLKIQSEEKSMNVNVPIANSLLLT